MHLDGDAEPEERERDRAGTDERRQERGDEAAEDPEREEQDEREGDQLGAAQVALDRLGHLARGDRAAAEADLRIAGEGAARSRSAASFDASPPPRAKEHEHDAVVVDDRPRDGGIAIDPSPHAGDVGRRRRVTSARMPGSASTPVVRSTSTFAQPALGGEVGELGRRRRPCAGSTVLPMREGDRDRDGRERA